LSICQTNLLLSDCLGLISSATRASTCANSGTMPRYMAVNRNSAISAESVGITCLSPTFYHLHFLVIAMPRDADSGKVALKRGDACLYCRKRRIKCSAEKPSCSQCIGKRECTYDNGKPVSRVRQLEDKVAQLESMLLQTSSRRPSESEGESSRMGSRSGSGNVQTNLSGNRSTPSSDIKMQQEPIPEGSGPSFEGGMDMQYDLNAIQQQFSDATSGLSNDFFSFGGSMFGDTNQPTQLPMLSNPNQDATAIFDFSTLDPNFMSLVNSFGDTLQTPQPVPPQPQPTAPQQTNVFASTVTDDTSTGFTPYLNPDYNSSANDPSPSMSTGYPLSRMDNTVPTPGLHFEQLSNTIKNARNEKIAPSPFIGEPTWSTGSGSGSGPSPYANPSQAGSSTKNVEPSIEEWDTRIAQARIRIAINSRDRPIRGPGLALRWIRKDMSWLEDGLMPMTCLVLLGIICMVSPYVYLLLLIGRLDLFFSGMRMFAQIFHVPRFFAR
jgi:hypothetical protein